eukprot:95-Heterococcus_DN1.PRE.1
MLPAVVPPSAGSSSHHASAGAVLRAKHSAIAAAVAPAAVLAVSPAATLLNTHTAAASALCTRCGSLLYGLWQHCDMSRLCSAALRDSSVHSACAPAVHAALRTLCSTASAAVAAV